MKLEKIASLCFFVCPAHVPVKAGGAFSVLFEEKGHLVLNKTHTLSRHEGAFRIPFSLLKEGKNTLTLSTPEGSFPSEGLTLENGTVYPSGIHAEEFIPLILKELRRLDKALKAQAEEICALKEKTKERALFA